MEVQITDFENAAYSIFVVLLIRAILMFDVNFYIPLSKASSFTAPVITSYTKTISDQSLLDFPL
jgi:hypothetical protein